MAVLERAYTPYVGPLSPEWSRFLIIPRDALRDVFRSKIFTGLYLLPFVWSLVCAVLIYLHHNFTVLSAWQLNVQQLLPIDTTFFRYFVVVGPGYYGFFLAMLIAPSQVSRDLTNNALPLVLSRPFSRTEYVVGKMSIVIILLSFTTWIPGVILFVLQSYLAGWSWFSQNIPIVSAVFIGSLVWILLLALMTQTISAWVRWRLASRAVLLAVFFIPSVFSAVINEIFRTQWGYLFDLQALIWNIWSGLFGQYVGQQTVIDTMGVEQMDPAASAPPLWTSWLVLFLICAACLALLSRKVKAYEVVK